MRIEWMHPADQLVSIMDRIYRYGMTTTSGGNLSILDENGDIWITPAGIDKGALTRQDIVRVKPDGTIIGIHRPSSEFPFHQVIYRTRPDIQAIIHAHSPALVAFSIARRIPSSRLLCDVDEVCGRVGMATYALPGSEQLGKNIAHVFEQGVNAVMLENHGVVVGEKSLIDAFKIFEMLDFSARLESKASRLGPPTTLTHDQMKSVGQIQNPHLEEFVPPSRSSEERYIRAELVKLISRSYDQRLFTSTQGTFSHRLGEDSFIITPHAIDRKSIEPEDLVRIERDKQEAGKVPSRSVLLHQAIYATQPHVNAIIIAHPPNITAFAITDMAFDSRTIPESYILLRNVAKLPFGTPVFEPQMVADQFTKDHPLVLVKNDCVIATGSTALQVFDRLEVIEYSADAIIASQGLGEIVHINDGQIKEIEMAFGL